MSRDKEKINKTKGVIKLNNNLLTNVVGGYIVEIPAEREGDLTYYRVYENTTGNLVAGVKPAEEADELDNYFNHGGKAVFGNIFTFLEYEYVLSRNVNLNQ